MDDGVELIPHVATNCEMSQLQQQLTPDQKDQVYQVLGDNARKEAEQPGNRFDPAAIEAAKLARVEALRPILTPEQMKAYESNPTTSFGTPGAAVITGHTAVRVIQMGVKSSE